MPIQNIHAPTLHLFSQRVMLRGHEADMDSVEHGLLIARGTVALSGLSDDDLTTLVLSLEQRSPLCVVSEVAESGDGGDPDGLGSEAP